MKKIALTVLLGISLSALHAQNVDTSQRPGGDVNIPGFTKVDSMAHFRGGDSAWNAYITHAVMKKMDYPNRKRAGGILEAQYIIMTDGRIDSVYII